MQTHNKEYYIHFLWRAKWKHRLNWAREYAGNYLFARE